MSTKITAEMNKLAMLIKNCNCGVHLTVNQHRDYYQTAEQALRELDDRECPPDISDIVRAGILATGNLVELQFYPTTPIGFFLIIHYDIDAALDSALQIMGLVK